MFSACPLSGESYLTVGLLHRVLVGSSTRIHEKEVTALDYCIRLLLGASALGYMAMWDANGRMAVLDKRRMPGQ